MTTTKLDASWCTCAEIQKLSPMGDRQRLKPLEDFMPSALKVDLIKPGIISAVADGEYDNHGGKDIYWINNSCHTIFITLGVIENYKFTGLRGSEETSPPTADKMLPYSTVPKGGAVIVISCTAFLWAMPPCFIVAYGTYGSSKLGQIVA